MLYPCLPVLSSHHTAISLKAECQLPVYSKGVQGFGVCSALQGALHRSSQACRSACRTCLAWCRPQCARANIRVAAGSQHWGVHAGTYPSVLVGIALCMITCCCRHCINSVPAMILQLFCTTWDLRGSNRCTRTTSQGCALAAECQVSVPPPLPRNWQCGSSWQHRRPRRPQCWAAEAGGKVGAPEARQPSSLPVQLQLSMLS